MKVIFIHHGNRKLGLPPSQDDDLTELGYKDCALVAELLNNQKIKDNVKAIYTSKIFRCKTTANLINKNLNLSIYEDDRLDEYKSVPNESWSVCQCRIINFLDMLVEKYKDNDFVICVTSGVNVGAFICKAFKLTPTEDTPFIGIPSCSPLVFEFKKD